LEFHVIVTTLDLFVLTTRVYSAEFLTDFSYTNFTVSYYRDALGRLRVHLNIILFLVIEEYV